MKTEVFIGERKGAWKLVYCDDGIQPAGFYFVNAGDPKTYSPASKDGVFDALEKLVAAQPGVHPTLPPARHKLVSCPQCKLMFGVDLPASQSG